MPTMMYSHTEMAEAIRLGWLTGIRDALIGAQGHTLSDEQAAVLARFATDPKRLHDTVSTVLKLQRVIPRSIAHPADVDD